MKYNLFCKYERNGKTYDVYLAKSIKNKKIHYRFRNDKFYITAPNWYPKKFLLSDLSSAFAKLLERQEDEVKPFNEKGIYIFGEFKEFNDGFVEIFGKKILFVNLDDFYKKVKKLVLPVFTERTKYYEQMMNVPRYKVNLRKKVSNYGVNSRRTNTITYSYILMHYSIEIIDEVIVHELSHYYEWNHSKKFYAVMDRYLPNHKELDYKLRKRIYK